jgi:hypothetical protein
MRDWEDYLPVLFTVGIVLLVCAVAYSIIDQERNYDRLTEECRAREGVPVRTRGHTSSFVCLRKDQAIDVQ